MTDQSIEDASRREFEVYLATHPDFEGEFLERTVDGKYIVKIIEAHWETWKAARQSSQSEPVATLSINIHDEYSLTLNAFEDGEDDGENYARLIAMLGKGHHKLYTAPQQAIPSGWISVTDNAPERIHGMKILCFGNGYIFESEYEDGYWVNIGGEDFTHWMPLPASPTAPIESDK
jgi:hypothetical protein